MDPELIYEKTASGEEAMHKRTRVMQRNVRMVLILVDGQSTVADLCMKTGNPKLTESALGELEKGGFIVPLLEQDSLWAESKKVAQEIRAAAINKVAQIARPKKVSGDGEKSALSGGAKPASKPPANVDSMFQIPLRSDSLFSQFSAAPKLSEPELADLAADAGSMPSLVKSAKTRTEPSIVSAKLASSVEKPKSPDLPKIRRAKKGATSWSLRLLSGVVLLGVIVVLGVFLFPYDSYLPGVERAFADSVGQPVHVERMRVVVYPSPYLELGGVSIGDQANASLRIARLRLQPAVETLNAPKIQFRKAVASGVVVDASVVDLLSSVFVNAAKSTALAGFDHLEFSDARVAFAGLELSGLSGEATMSSGGRLQSISLRTADRDLTVTATPGGAGVGVGVEGVGWRPVAGSPFVFDSLTLRGVVQPRVFSINSLELRLFDGVVSGHAALQDGDTRGLSGEISFVRVNAAKLGTALGVGESLSGASEGRLRFSSEAEAWSAIFGSLQGEGEFSVARGRFRGVDLAEAVRRVSDSPVQGGATSFEKLSGKLALTPTGYQFSRLILDSGLMQSTGRVDVDKDLNIKGRMELQLRGSVNQSRVPVVISGPLSAPQATAMRK